MYWQIAAAVFGLDAAVKYKMEKELPEEGDGTLCCGDIILLRKTYNKGAMLGMGRKAPRAVAGATALLAVGLACALRSGMKEKGGGMYKLGLAFLLGGGANNVCDRLVNGHVIDYFSFRVKWKWLNKIIFNLSDMFIFLGAVLAAVGSVKRAPL